MTFNDDANIGGGRVSKRGRNAAIGAGGGVVVIALVVVSQLVGFDVTGLAPILGGGAPAVEETTLDHCETGEDANENIDCRMAGAAVALDAYWETQVDGYRGPALVIFVDSVSTGCGNATSAVGPFYCPPDETVYIDTRRGAFDGMLLLGPGKNPARTTYAPPMAPRLMTTTRPTLDLEIASCTSGRRPS